MNVKPPPKNLTFEQKLEILRRIGGTTNKPMRNVDETVREIKKPHTPSESPSVKRRVTVERREITCCRNGKKYSYYKDVARFVH